MASDTDTPTQDGRTAILATPLGKDVLLFSRMDCIEGMGELFEFRVEALSLTAEINFDQVLGQNCSIHLNTSDDVGRDFSGVLAEARWLEQRGDFYVYSLVLRPWLWLLSLTSDCRIYPNMTPKQIINQVFQNRGFSGASYVHDITTAEYPTLEYTVQYRETDMNFVLRLMEEYGIYYYFQFASGSGASPSAHQLVLADSATYTPLPNPTEIVYTPATVSRRRDVQQFNNWINSNAMVSGVFTLNDYNYESPGANLLATAKYNYKFTHGDMEIYDFPGDYDKQNDGQTLANVLRDAERTRNQRSTAAGYAPTLTPGYTINRSSTTSGSSSGSSANPDDGEYLLLRCSHAFGYQTYSSGSSGGGGAVYVGTYELAKSDLPFRMPRHSRKPFIAGTQSALVVGKQGEEIDVDEQGRIAVTFYWDRKKTGSRRIRVAQFWAGNQRGTLYLPRIGDEVLIQYDEGDPDRPLVVGSVYNGANTVPTPLPAKKTHSGILTRSSKGGGGYNMLLFEDLAGSEFVKLRCQKDLMVKALHDETRVIGNDQTENITGNVSKTVNGNETINIGSTGGQYSLTATQKITITVGASSITMDPSSITIKSPTITIQADASLSESAPNVSITGDIMVSING